ncbi:MAG: hypothetical protein Q7S40_20985 [Opitutaceae bacterium]|nr:hypothetical protein [Opitutaceae bacterium]
MSSAAFRFVRIVLGWLLVAAAPAVTRAQATATLSPDRVTFYTEPNFKGEALAVEAGAAVENLDRMRRSTRQPWTYAISSVKVEGAARAVVHSGPNFSGDRLEITASITDLYGASRPTAGGTWDRCIASFSVAGPQRPMAAPAPAAPLPPVRYESAPPPQTVYVVPTPAGPPPRVVAPRPRYDPRMVDQVINRAFREVLGRGADPEGLRHYREKLLREGWSERDIVVDLQRSREARAVNADEAIRQAYHEVLGRDPDANGLAHYRAKWRDGWTQGQIRDDLRRSTEGRGNHIRDVITKAYRDLLGREPDPEGYAIYEKAMRERGYTERDIRQAIMNGDEYRQRARSGAAPTRGRGR